MDWKPIENSPHDDFKDMSEDDLLEWNARSLEIKQAIDSATDRMPCPDCHAPVAKRRDGRMWSMECACGWSAAGMDNVIVQ